jgi:hypothetical protein
MFPSKSIILFLALGLLWIHACRGTGASPFKEQIKTSEPRHIVYFLASIQYGRANATVG